MSDKEIITALATKVMGWVKVNERFAPHCGCSMVYDQRQETLGMRFVGAACGMTVHVERDRWNPLTSISDAFQVVEKLQELGWTCTLALRQFERQPRDRNVFHGCRIVGTRQKMQSFCERSETPARAICLSAIAAIEEKANQ